MNDFGPSIEKHTDGRASSLKGGTGKGPEISISTERGSVLVRKAGALETGKVEKSEKAEKVPPVPERF